MKLYIYMSTGCPACGSKTLFFPSITEELTPEQYQDYQKKEREIAGCPSVARQVLTIDTDNLDYGQAVAVIDGLPADPIAELLRGGLGDASGLLGKLAGLQVMKITKDQAESIINKTESTEPEEKKPLFVPIQKGNIH